MLLNGSTSLYTYHALEIEVIQVATGGHYKSSKFKIHVSKIKHILKNLLINFQNIF